MKSYEIRHRQRAEFCVNFRKRIFFASKKELRKTRNTL
jgi:hypothetical protein